MASVIHLVRHAAPPLKNQKRYWGKGDPGVDETSLIQAGRIADETHPLPTRIFTSPLARARITAETIAEKLSMRQERQEMCGGTGVELEVMPDLAEINFGQFDGLTFAEAERLYPEAANEWAKQGDAFTFPEGESIPDFLSRAHRAYATCTASPDNAILCVTHGGVLAAWHCFFHNLPLETRFSFIPEYATLMTFTGRTSC